MRDRVKADYWMGHQTPEDGKRAVERALEHGFKGVKIKCKLEEPMFDRLEAMRDVAGPEFKVTVDPNERFYTAEQAIALAAELAGVAVDVLINNSGVNPDPLRQRFDCELDYSEWAETMNVNGEPSQFRRLEPATTN